MPKVSRSGCSALLLLSLVSSCESGDAPVPQPGENTGGTPGNVGLTACLDAPNELPRPPEGQLPCELIPPGLVL